MAEHQVEAHGAADRLAFFESVHEGFKRASTAAGAVDKSYRIAGFEIRLRFAGPALIRSIAPALAHLEVEPDGEPDLAVELFDSASCSTPMPLMARSLIELIRQQWWERLDRRGEIRACHGGRMRAVFHLGPDILSLLDTAEDRGLYWIEDAQNIPYYEKGYPLTTLLNWWMSRRDCLFVHGAAVGETAGGVLVSGRGGSGKSTTTLSCVDSGLGVVGDDYCVVDTSTRRAHSLYNSVKLKGEEDVQRFHRFEGCISNRDRVGGEHQEKALIFLHQHFPEVMRRDLPLRAILIPRVNGSKKTSIEPASRAAALRALAPSTILQLAGNESAAFRALAAMVSDLPTFELSLGSDLEQIPAVIRQLLATPEVGR